ncbi:MAG: ribosome maturation factor RimP [Clostridia bacterium]|nr:ribosome maturation factor RimP [Clostridia bacterium]
MKIEEKVLSLIESTINNLKIDVYDVEYVKEGSSWFLRIYIDKDGGVDINDCENVSRTIEPILDDADIIKGQYCLEVSSPGIERILRLPKHFEQNIGSKVEASFYKPIDGEKSFVGILKSADDNNIIIDDKKFERKDISKVKTVYEF